MGSPLYVFAAYKFVSSHYEAQRLESAIRTAVRNAERKLQARFKGVELRLVEQQEISSGQYVGEFVKSRLERSALGVFELSDRALNVVFELGYFMGLSSQRYGKDIAYGVLLQSESISHTDLMSDLLGRFVHRYGREQSGEPKYRAIVQ